MRYHLPNSLYIESLGLTFVGESVLYALLLACLVVVFALGVHGH